MKVKYYEVHDCEYESIGGSHVIIAPEGTDEELLKKYDFVQLIDGRWCHYITDDEKLHMLNHQNDDMLVFSLEHTETPERNAPAAYIIVMLSVFALVFGILSLFTAENVATPLILTTVGTLGLLLSRIIFRNNKLAKTIIYILGVLALILIIGFIIFMYLAASAIASCGEQACDFAGDVGNMGSQFINII
ncbi:MAG: hypothetical protein GXY08_11105 [Ruminococcus sp.]|nr:hypothetical protein [Ruminococcus sp.]